MLSTLEKNMTDLVRDADLTQSVSLAFKGNSSPVLTKVLSSLSVIEDQAPKVKKAQRRQSNREALLAKKNSNR